MITRQSLHSRLSVLNVFGHFSVESSLYEWPKYFSKIIFHTLELIRRFVVPGVRLLCGQIMSSLKVFKLESF
jgi:hypothetical protein